VQPDCKVDLDGPFLRYLSVAFEWIDYFCSVVKTIRFIFGSVLLVLAMLPCADSYAKAAVHTHESNGSHAHENQRATGDLCSPFCTCGCCSTPVVIKFSWHYGVIGPAPLSEWQYPIYRFTFTPSFIHNIWQPPKINA